MLRILSLSLLVCAALGEASADTYPARVTCEGKACVLVKGERTYQLRKNQLAPRGQDGTCERDWNKVAVYDYSNVHYWTHPDGERTLGCVSPTPWRSVHGQQ